MTRRGGRRRGWFKIISAYGRASVGRNDAEAGYRCYLAMTRLGTDREATAVFSIPGVELRQP